MSTLTQLDLTLKKNASSNYLRSISPALARVTQSKTPSRLHNQTLERPSFYGNNTNTSMSKLDISLSKLPKKRIGLQKLVSLKTQEEEGETPPEKARANIPNYLIMFPNENILSPQAETKKGSFVSFNSLLQKKLNRIEDPQDESLLTSFTTKDMLEKQLAFNKKQENMFRLTTKRNFDQVRDDVKFLAKESERKKKLSKVSIRPSPTFRAILNLENSVSHNDDGSIEEESKDDTERGNTSSLKDWIKLDVGSCVWYWYSAIDETHAGPTVREGASFVTIGKLGYLYGGVSKEFNNQIEVLDIGRMQWSQLKQTGELPDQGRIGHSMDCYGKNLVLFGGATCYNKTLNIRRCLNEVYYFSTETNQWTRQKSANDEIVAPRRNHASVVVGRHLLVYGGIGTDGSFLNDIKILDMLRGEWKDDIIENHPREGIAFHKGCVVISSNKTKSSLYKIVETRPDKGPKIQEEGVYFYGGKLQDGESSGALKILKIGQRTLSWMTPKTHGMGPGPRVQHTMVHCAPLNIIVVHGGRNDHLYSKGLSPYVEEIFVLELEKLTWYNVPVTGKIPVARCSHVTGVFGTKLVIFGGINMSQYCATNTDILEMNPVEVARIKMEHQMEMKKTQKGFPTISSRNRIVDESFNRESKEDEGKKKGYSGIMTFQPVMSKKQFEFKRQNGMNLLGDIPGMITGVSSVSEMPSTKSLAGKIKDYLEKNKGPHLKG